MVKFGFRKKFERSNQINKYMSDTIGRNVNKNEYERRIEDLEKQLEDSKRHTFLLKGTSKF
jgi:predicted SpoU family rRNA methylase